MNRAIRSRDFASRVNDGNEGSALVQLIKDIRVEPVEILNLFSKECIEPRDLLCDSDDLFTDRFFCWGELTARYENFAIVNVYLCRQCRFYP